jgi:hypothetical protein
VQRSTQVIDAQIVVGVPAQSIVLRHVRPQRPVIVSHTGPAALIVQSLLARHGATQAPDVVSHTAPFGCATQSLSAAQRATHMFVIGLQMLPVIELVQSI